MLLVSVSFVAFYMMPSTIYAGTENMSDEFKSLLDAEGNLVMNAVEPTNDEEWYLTYELTYYTKYLDMQLQFSNVSADYSSCDLTIHANEINKETHTVNIVYNYDSEVKGSVKTFAENFPSDKEFSVSDLELINYWLYGKDYGVEHDNSPHNIYNYSGELKSYVDETNLEFLVDSRKGTIHEFLWLEGGVGRLAYDDTIYYIDSDVTVNANHVIYVPESTESTKDALMDAVQKRIDDYAGIGKVSVEYGGSDIYTDTVNYYDEILREYDVDSNEWNNYNIIKEAFIQHYNQEDSFLRNAEGGHWFTAVVNGSERRFIVIKDSSKMITPVFDSKDVITGVSISSDDSSIPLDTFIDVEQLTSGSEYEEVMEVLNVENSITYDITLYSNSLQKFITKVIDGDFEIRLPIPEFLKNKDLIVYYVENGEKTEYDVKIDGESALFYTNHLSIYTLAEEKVQSGNTPNTDEEQNPTDEQIEKQEPTEQTDKKNGSPSMGDDSSVILMLSLMGLALAILAVITVSYKKKRIK